MLRMILVSMFYPSFLLCDRYDIVVSALILIFSIRNLLHFWTIVAVIPLHTQLLLSNAIQSRIKICPVTLTNKCNKKINIFYAFITSVISRGLFWYLKHRFRVHPTKEKIINLRYGNKFCFVFIGFMGESLQITREATKVK